MKKGKTVRVTIASLVGLAVVCTADAAKPAKQKRSEQINNEAQVSIFQGKQGTEGFERDVDRAALSAQKVAEQKLKKLIDKNRNQRNEPDLLSRLAEIYQQNASIYFRLAHATALGKSRPINLQNYKKEMSMCIETINTLLKRFPQYPDEGRMVYMRGKAYEEIGRRADAKHDYMKVIREFADLPEVYSAIMSVAQFEIDDNRHSEAVQLLQKIEQHPEIPHYPFAIYKLAWSHYNLKHSPKALAYLEKHIRYYDGLEKIAKENQLNFAQADGVIRETSQNDTPLFYLQAFENKDDGFQIDNALPYFRKLGDSRALGRMNLRFAKLLRAHNHDGDLDQWKNLLMEKEPALPETVDVVVVVFETQFGRKNYKEIMASSGDLVRLYQMNQDLIKKTENYGKIQKLLLDSAKDLQALTIKNKQATEVSRLSRTLASVYDSFIKIVPENDPRIPGVHYNLAETLFEIKDFEGATDHYRWIVKNWKEKAGGVKVRDASLKAIASRYEILRSKQMVPESVQSKTMDMNQEAAIDSSLVQYVRWIDRHLELYPDAMPQVEAFLFDAHRALYQQNKIQLVTDRMLQFATRHTRSKFAVPSAKLVLDTFVASANWQRVYELATDLVKLKGWQDAKFVASLDVIASDAYTKRVENLIASGNREEALTLGQAFLKRYPKSHRTEDVLFLTGKSALELKQDALAETLFTDLVTRFPGSPNAGPALLSKAQFDERRYDFKRAAGGYRTYLTLPSEKTQAKDKDIADLRKKILLYAWLSEDWDGLRSSLEQKDFCAGSLEEECAYYQAVDAVFGNRKDFDIPQALSKASKGKSELRALWAASVLERKSDLAISERNALVKTVATKWSELDADLKFTLVTRMSEALPRAFEANRLLIQKSARTFSSEKTIKLRVAMIKELEETAAQVLKLPWARIRVGVMREIAQAYTDFSLALQAADAPKGLSPEETNLYKETLAKLAFPFDEKAQEIRGKAFEIAARLSVESGDFEAIRDPYFKDNPSLGAKLRGEIRFDEAIQLDLDLLDRLDPEGDWSELADSKLNPHENPSDFARKEIVLSLTRKSWARASFIIREAKNRGLLTENRTLLARAMALSQIGAQAEALAEIDALRGSLSEKPRGAATVLLISNAVRTLSPERTRELIQDFEKQTREKASGVSSGIDGEDEAFVVAYGAVWAQAALSTENTQRLLRTATRATRREHSSWAKRMIAESQSGPEPASSPAIPALDDGREKTQPRRTEKHNKINKT